MIIYIQTIKPEKSLKEVKRMNTVTVDEKKTSNRVQKGKFFDVLKKILMYTGIIICGIVMLVVLYQILEFLLGAAILLIAFLFPIRRR